MRIARRSTPGVREDYAGAASGTGEQVAAASRTEVRRMRRAVGRLHAAADRAGALLTIPSDPVRRTWLAGTATRPAVEPDLWALHVRYARDAYPDVLATLVEHYRPHAEAHARRHFRHGEPIDDLTQVAYEALVQALQRFDPTRGIPFLAFANPTIVGSLRRHVRDVGWAIRVPRRVHELAAPTRDATELLTHDLGRRPSVGEIADFIGVDEREVLDAMAADEARITRSLDAPHLQAACRPSRSSAASTGASRASRTARGCCRASSACPRTTAGCSRCTSVTRARRPRSPRCWSAARCRFRACCARRSTGCAGRWSTRDGTGPV